MRKPRVGDWMEVRSKEEILQTLDKRGRMEGLPFMPQMFQYCGQRFQVYKRAHKTCDFVYGTWGRKLPNGVHLDLRCDGLAYGGCDNACLLFWKEAWLKPINGHAPLEGSNQDPPRSTTQQLNYSGYTASCTEADVLAGTRPEGNADELAYSCQMTDVMKFTSLQRWWDIRQYVEDYTSGNVSLGRMFLAFSYAGYNALAQAGIGLGRPLRSLYEKLHGVPWPRSVGEIPAGQTTPTSSLNLKPGELVRIKPHREILATVDTNGKNRGMHFDAEMVPYCGGVYRVRTRVEKFLNERTGRLTTLKDPSIILESVWCSSRYSHCRMFCPRSLYSWWHEVWLERLPEDPDNSSNPR
jgi:hypothetical protein